MAPRLPGFTRASSLGPISIVLDQHGGSVARVLKRVDLPFAILEQRELVVPLREQFRLLEAGAREIGDAFFGARLGAAVEARELSAFGAWVCAAETLQAAIGRTHAGINAMLQTSTVLTLSRRGPAVRWSIEFVEPESEGRHHNEFLGLGYMISMVRGYAGPHWRPNAVMTALPRGSATRQLEDIYGTNVSHGHAAPAIEFDASLLCSAPFAAGLPRSRGIAAEPPVPEQSDMLATVASVLELALLEGYPRVEWVAKKLGMTRRSLQRRLQDHGTTFNKAVEGLLRRRAEVLLAEGSVPVTEVAFTLGYADPAHFTRAFRRWAGVSPSQYRQSALNSAS